MVVTNHWPNNINEKERENPLLKLTSIEIILSKLQKERFVYNVHLAEGVEVILNQSSNDRGLDRGHALFLLCLPSWPFWCLNI